MTLKLPRATAEALDTPLYEGNRHQLILQVTLSLVGEQWPDNEIFHLIRNWMPSDKTDKEIWDAIRGAHSKNPTPSKSRYMTDTHYAKPAPPTKDQAIFLAQKFIGSRQITEDRLKQASKVPIPDDLTKHATAAFLTLYEPSENINIVCQFTQPERKPNKANPQGAGKTLGRDEWITWFEKEVPRSQAGAWMRPNPVTAQGSGRGGAIQDKDVTACRFLLVESDFLDLKDQLGLLSKLRLPIAAIISSGGSSYHAWVKLDAKNHEEYSTQAERVLKILERFGIDQANKNPSRLARLPGVYRVIGASEGGEQKLIYLNPNPKSEPIL